MTDYIDGLEQDLVEAARRQAGAPSSASGVRVRRWSGLRGGLLAAALAVTVAGTAAAGTLTVLRGSPIPAARDVPAEQTPAAGTSHVTSVRAADPAEGAPPWTVRVARGSTGLLCSTVGQVVDGEFGLVGLDGRFRPLSEAASDSCGVERRDAASLVGARVFDARHVANVRTVVSGVAGDDLRSVIVRARGKAIRVPTAEGGVFATALRGYPEDSAISATLRFADGRREVHPFGVSPYVELDPEGGQAWRVVGGLFVRDGRTCVHFWRARPTVGAPLSPVACGVLGPRNPRLQRGWFLAARRLVPGVRSRGAEPWGRATWHHPPRTAVWGAVGHDVRDVTAQAPGGRPRSIVHGPLRVFLGMFPGSVRPADITVRFHLRDGRTVIRHGDDRLVAHRIPVAAPVGPRRSR